MKNKTCTALLLSGLVTSALLQAAPPNKAQIDRDKLTKTPTLISLSYSEMSIFF